MERSWPVRGGLRNRPVAVRFWEKVEVLPNGCWEWRGARTNRDYGVIQVEGRGVYVHRLALEWKMGRALAAGEMACHTCDNPPCVRRDHLFVGTNSDNIRDASSKGRLPRQQTPEWIAKRMASKAATLAAKSRL